MHRRDIHGIVHEVIDIAALNEFRTYCSLGEGVRLFERAENEPITCLQCVSFWSRLMSLPLLPFSSGAK